jgi:hypothetical protein
VEKVNLEIDGSERPVQQGEWFEEEGVVKIKIQKFHRKSGKWLCKLLRKSEYFTINLDELGSFVWKRIDGEKNVAAILEDLMAHMGESNNKETLEKRFFLFLHMLHGRGLLAW